MNLLRTIAALLLLSTAALAQDSVTLQTPAPPPPAYIGASYSGQPGPASYYYWVSAVYPGGESGVAGPAAVRGAANTLSGSNTVSVSWSAAFGATAYNVIRTLTPVFSTNCSDCLLASGVTATTTADTGAALSAYAGAGAAAPATGGLTINVRDYAAPRLELRLNGQVVATFDVSGIATGGGEGGASALGELSDVTETSPTEHDIVTRGPAGWINGNILTRVAAAGLTDGRVPFVSGGALTDSANFTWTGTELRTAKVRLVDAGSATVKALDGSLVLSSSEGSDSLEIPTSGVLQFRSNGQYLINIGGTQTFLVKDTTSTTGVTLGLVDAGAGQGTTDLWRWRNNAGTTLARVGFDGRIDAPAFYVNGGLIAYDDIAGSPPLSFSWTVLENDAAVSVGDDVASWIVPAEYNGYALTSVVVHTWTAGSGGSMTTMVTKCTAVEGSKCAGLSTVSDLLSPTATLEDGESSTASATTPPVVITAGALNVLATGDVLRFDVDTVHTTTAANGLTYILGFTAP